MNNIMPVGTVPVTNLLVSLKQHPELWNEHRARLEQYASPHGGVSDIWVRYNDINNYAGDLGAFNNEHDSVWYDAARKLPEAKAIALHLMAQFGGERLGGVLITRIPPGGRVEPHTDSGWHAEYYEKFAVQLESAPGQSFNFDGEQLEPRPGDVYWFNNRVQHWVINDSAYDRITMIVCIKRGV